MSKVILCLYPDDETFPNDNGIEKIIYIPKSQKEEKVSLLPKSMYLAEKLEQEKEKGL